MSYVMAFERVGSIWLCTSFCVWGFYIRVAYVNEVRCVFVFVWHWYTRAVYVMFLYVSLTFLSRSEWRRALRRKAPTWAASAPNVCGTTWAGRPRMRTTVAASASAPSPGASPIKVPPCNHPQPSPPLPQCLFCGLVFSHLCNVHLLCLSTVIIVLNYYFGSFPVSRGQCCM